jgi:hypothetical protein
MGSLRYERQYRGSKESTARQAEEERRLNDTYKVFVGIDWGQESHQVSVSDNKGDILGERAFPHRGDALVELSDWLLTLPGGDVSSIAVALEVPRGPVVDTLLERGYHVFSINPKQLDRFRDRYSVAGAKDDRRDARILGSAPTACGTY